MSIIICLFLSAVVIAVMLGIAVVIIRKGIAWQDARERRQDDRLNLDDDPIIAAESRPHPPKREPDFPSADEMKCRASELSKKRNCHDPRCKGYGKHRCHNMDCKEHNGAT